MSIKSKISLICVLLFWSTILTAAQSDTQENMHNMSMAVTEKMNSTVKSRVIDKDFIQLPVRQGLTQISCAPLQACDIVLPVGEKVKGLYFGDSIRWIHEIAESGEEDFKQAHIILKPQQENLETNLIITSSKSTYHIKLISVRAPKNYQVEFYRQRNNEINVQNKHQLHNEKNLVDLDKLDFSYMIKYPFLSHLFMGDQLKYVFNDGQHVYIKIPKKWMTRELPALFVENDGDLFITNYRVKGSYYMVDHLFQTAVLVFNVGKKQMRLEIIHQG